MDFSEKFLVSLVFWYLALIMTAFLLRVKHLITNSL